MSQNYDHTTVIEVRDTTFANALYSAGVPFLDPKHPFTLIAFADGSRCPAWRFRHKTTDNRYKTEELCVAQKDPVKWIAANPDHPFSYALTAAMNAVKFAEAEQNKRALVGFKIKGGRIMYVFENSRKCAKLRAMGATQI